MQFEYEFDFWMFSDKKCVDVDLAREFYKLSVDLFEPYGVEFNFYHVNSPKRSSIKLMKLNTRAANKILNCYYHDLDGLTLFSYARESNSFANDSSVELHLKWAPLIDRATLKILFDENQPLPFGKIVCDLLSQLSPSIQFDYGYGNIVLSLGYRHRFFNKELPRLLILDSWEAKKQWFDASDLERREKLRSVYLVNFINSSQLAFPVGTGTLRDFVSNAEGTDVEECENFLVWHVPFNRVFDLRDQLASFGALISYPVLEEDD